jgi:hypothetical protein
MLSNDFSVLFQDKFISEYLQKNSAILLPFVNKSLTSFFLIDLQQLPSSPINFAEILLRWIIAANKKRIENDEEIIITFDLIKRCPIWKVINMPVKSIKATPESFNKSKSPVPSRKTNRIGSINKRIR